MTTAKLIEALRAAYTAWNNPPSDGLPDGAGVVLEAADALASSREEIDRLRAELERHQDEEDKASRDMQVVIQALRDRATAAESERDEARKQRDEIGRAWDSADARAKAAESELARVKAEAAAQFKRDGEKLTEADRRAEALKRALEPFAVKLSDNYHRIGDNVPFTAYFSVGQLRAAARALSPSEEEAAQPLSKPEHGDRG